MTSWIISENEIWFTQFQNKDKKIENSESKEFESRLKFETHLKYGWFHLKLYSMFQDFSQRSIKTHLDQIFYNFKS